ncbi:MFS transporter [Myxococcota bacterium]|nr:MFS transporter [Myxococcota bacterium]
MSDAAEVARDAQHPSFLDRFLRLFSDVRAGEGVTALAMLCSIFLLLVSYYVLKVVREPLILATPNGAALKSYASAGQAIVLMGFVPFYSWFSSKVDRRNLILAVGVFFLACIELFALGVVADVPYLGIAFFIWVGIFSLSLVAQFWAFANDLYDKGAGERLFPIIGIGATVGSWLGSVAAGELFAAKLEIELILQVAAALLAVHVALLVFIHRRESARTHHRREEKEQLSKAGGFGLVFRSRYLLLMAVLFLILNVVNTIGEYVLSANVSAALPDALAAAGLGGASPDAPEVKAFTKAYFGEFYGEFFSGVNVAAVLLQAFVVSRIVKYVGIRGVVLLLPIVSLSAYGLIGLVGGLAVTRWSKTAENSIDYSVMNTGRAMLWLPTSREEKYKAKQAIDTFFVRFGDVTAAGVVFVGKEVLAFAAPSFAIANVVLVGLWLFVALLLLREHARLAPPEARP